MATKPTHNGKPAVRPRRRSRRKARDPFPDVTRAGRLLRTARRFLVRVLDKPAFTDSAELNGAAWLCDVIGDRLKKWAKTARKEVTS